MEHREWVGGNYAIGVEGQQLALVGFSHYWGVGEDEEITLEVIENQLAGRRHRFMSSIEGYFNEGRDLWRKVMFFNYLPTSVGNADRKFDYGSVEQHEAARQRVMRIASRHRPQKMVVFSTKAWRSLTRTSNQEVHRLSKELPEGFEWRTYEAGDHTFAAYGLRHTQGASRDEMRRATRMILDAEVAS